MDLYAALGFCIRRYFVVDLFCLRYSVLLKHLIDEEMLIRNPRFYSSSANDSHVTLGKSVHLFDKMGGMLHENNPTKVKGTVKVSKITCVCVDVSFGIEAVKNLWYKMLNVHWFPSMRGLNMLEEELTSSLLYNWTLMINLKFQSQFLIHHCHSFHTSLVITLDLHLE